MNPVLLWSVAFALAGSASTAHPANPPVAKLPDTFQVEAIDAYLAAQTAQPGRAGLSVALVQNGRVVLARGYGWRSLEPRLPVAPDTVFAIGSVSKQFTCAAILLLAEQGRLSVQDKVAKYYPELTRAQDISLLDLMNHTSGYPDYYPLDFVDRRMGREIAPDELLRRYAGGRLDFEPGSRWSYSNTGFILLGRIVERVSGEPLGQFLSGRFFTPLGMSRSSYETTPRDGSVARGYTTFALSDPTPVAPEGTGWLGGAGGVYSTPSDLVKWNLALMDGTVLKPESWRLMTTPRELPDGKSTRYGCGVSIGLQGGRQVVSHGGAVSGFNAWSGFIPSTRSSLVMMGNLDGGLDGLPDQILGLLLKDPRDVPAVQGPSAVEASKRLFASLQKGRIDRPLLSEEFSAYLTDDMIRGAARRLKPYGKPLGADLVSRRERGGMEVSTVRLRFKTAALLTLMYRQPNGVVEQFFVSRD